MIKKFLKNNNILFFLFSSIFFYTVFGYALNYGRTYDDVYLVEKFLNSPGDAKFLSSHLYAKFHFYPIYFLSHELDNFLTFLFNYFAGETLNITIAKNTNFLLHIFNSYLLFELLRLIFKPQDLREKLAIYLSSFIFLVHPIGSQIIFNVTTRNESLALFFSLLSFIYAFKLYEKKLIINFFFVGLLYFFALCSKLIAVSFIAIIPVTIFLINFKNHNFKENIKRVTPILLTLIIVFIIFYQIRSNFINQNQIQFYSDIDKIFSSFLIAVKFYIRGLFYPFEHIYIYADNYNKDFQSFIFLTFVLIVFISLWIFYKFKDPMLFLVILWISATLSVPVLFNVIEKGFPLISKLAERYQYSSIPAISLLVAWVFLKLINKKYFNVLITSIVLVIISLSTLIQIDRSYVYKNNSVFFNKAYENSPDNYHEYFFSVPLTETINRNDEKEFLFYLYQLHYLYPVKEEYIFMFMNYFASRDNQKGYDYFLNYLKIRTSFEPPIKLKLAEYYFKNKKYKKTEELIDQIFQDIDILIADHKERGIKIKITNPDIDDLYFLKGLALQKQNKLEEALGNFMLANLNNPMHATALYNSSVILKELGQIELAQKHFEDAIKINPFLRETVNNMINNKTVPNE